MNIFLKKKLILKKKVQQAVMNFARPTKNIIEFPERNNNERFF